MQDGHAVTPAGHETSADQRIVITFQGPLVHDGDFLQAEDGASGDRAKGGMRSRMHHYFQKQKNVVAPAIQASTSVY